MPAAESETTIRRLGRPGDLGWVLKAHGELYAEELGWDASFEALVAQIVADYASSPDPRWEAAWLAEVDGQRAGCVLCVADPENPGSAKLRALLVAPGGRGRGLGRGLLDEALEFARAAGYKRMRLWTNHPLTAARQLYLSHGFRLVEEEPHRCFGVELIGQVYELDLREPPA